MAKINRTKKSEHSNKRTTPKESTNSNNNARTLEQMCDKWKCQLKQQHLKLNKKELLIVGLRGRAVRFLIYTQKDTQDFLILKLSKERLLFLPKTKTFLI